MKKAFCLLLALCLALPATLVGCPAADTAYRMTRENQDVFVCRETGIRYTRAPEFYLPGTISQAAYATYSAENGYESYFYKIKDAAPTQYLCEADPSDHYPLNILVADGAHLPTITELGCDKILLCDASAEYFWMSANILDTVTLSDRIATVISAYTMGQEGTRPIEVPQSATELIFVSTEYPFNLKLTYYRYNDGTAYLYESGTGHCVSVAHDLFLGYILTPYA